MAPGGGRGGRTQDDVVEMGGQTLKRVMDAASKQWVYRPVDKASGEVISKAAFEEKQREERRMRAENDPKKQAEREKQWAAQQRAEIRNMRVEESQKMRREEHVRKLESGLVERRKPRRTKIANVPEPKLLLELREEMRVAVANGVRTKNPGQFAFIKTALDAEEAKHDAKVKAAREKAYQAERKKRGVKGEAWGGSDEYNSSDEEVVVRGSLADLDDPDYRRGPVPDVANGGGRGGGSLAAPRFPARVHDTSGDDNTRALNVPRPQSRRDGGGKGGGKGGTGSGGRGGGRGAGGGCNDDDAPELRASGDGNKVGRGGAKGEGASKLPAPKPLAEAMAAVDLGDKGSKEGRGRGGGRGGSGRGGGGRGGRGGRGRGGGRGGGGRGVPSQPLFEP